MNTSSQLRAVKTYRQRLRDRGMARFEVLGRTSDCDLIRARARLLAEEAPDAARLRATLSQAARGGPPRTGGILAALRQSPLVGTDLDLTRTVTPGRVVDM